MKLVDIILNEGVDENDFISDYENNDKVILKNRLSELPQQLTFKVDEDHLNEFCSDDRLLAADHNIPDPVSPALPAYEFQTGRVIAENYTNLSSSYNGADNMPLQLYADTDVEVKTSIIGNDPNDDANFLNDVTYYSAFFGRHIDIVTVEVGDASSSYNNYQTDVHPDLQDPDDSNASRFVPLDWPDLESNDNNQQTNGTFFSQHGLGVLSAAGGRICGFAKHANLYATYISTSSTVGSTDSTVEIINAITSWHNNKSVNPITGVKNPTIMIAEYQYLVDKDTCIPIDDIESITTPNGTVTQSGGTWGTDFSDFVAADSLPVRIDPNNNGGWKWCAVFPSQFAYTSLKSALEAAWDNGVVCINAAGNAGGTYVKSDDPEYNGTYMTTKSSWTRHDISASGGVVNSISSVSSSGATTYYPLRSYGPAGCKRDKSIDVAAGQNSMKYPILDGYSTRGPGIDIVGKGSDTWTAYPTYTMADGRWGYFSGTSCATPTVVGKAACEMEKYFHYTGSYPTPLQVKSLLQGSAKENGYGVESTDWSSVAAANATITRTEDEGNSNLARISLNSSLNGGVRYTDAVGTPIYRAAFDGRGFKRSFTDGKRTTSGAVYPRVKVRQSG